MFRKMFLPRLIFFVVFAFISITIRAENSVPYCYLYTGNSTSYPKPNYHCFNQKSFPVILTNPEEIKTLYLWDDDGSNNLQVLKSGDLFTSKTTNLEALVLGKCEIKEIEKGAFRGGNKVTELVLPYNQIEGLDLNVLEDLPSLEKLWLHDNPLTNFYSNSTFPRSNLTLLHLADCRLRSINANIFENLSNLKELYLYKNELTTLDWKMFRPLTNLEKVSVYENPFHCDCQIKFLLDYLDKRNIQWNHWYAKHSCSSSAVGKDVSQTPSIELLNKELIEIDWNLINRQYLVCPPQVDFLQKIESLENYTSLKCIYSGYPQPNVTWKIDEKILKIDNSNKYLIQTETTVGVDEPEYNYEFIQTFFISLLPYYSSSSTAKVTCQAFNSPFKSNESNAASVKLLNLAITSVISKTAFDTTVRNNISSNLQKPDVEYPQENQNLSTIILIIGAVAGFVLIIVGAVIIAILCRKPVPFYKFLPQRDHQPPAEDNPTGHVYDYIRMSWIRRQDGDGYETPISLSIQHAPLPPLPQRQNLGD